MIEDRNIEELYIPASVKHFTFHGVQYTINIKDGGRARLGECDNALSVMERSEG